MSILVEKMIYPLPNGMLFTKLKQCVTPGVWLRFGDDTYILADKVAEGEGIQIAQIHFNEENFGQSEYIRRMIIDDLGDKASLIFPALRHNQMVHRSEVVKLPSDKIMAVFDVIEVKKPGYRGKNPETGEGIICSGKDADHFVEELQNNLSKYHGSKICSNPSTDDVFPTFTFHVILRITPYVYYGNLSNTIVCAFSPRYTTTEHKDGFHFVKGEDGGYHVELAE